jgi:hypothetical protein
MEKLIDNDYRARDLSFCIIFVGSVFLAMQNLTDEQKKNTNYLREVHTGETLEEVKNSINSFCGFYKEV